VIDAGVPDRCVSRKTVNPGYGGSVKNVGRDYAGVRVENPF
jgi:hypothetical protein